VTRIPDREGRSPLWLTPGPGGILYVAGADGVITGYPVAGGEPFAALDVGTEEPITAIGTELPSGRLMTVGYRSGRVELWNIETQALITELSRHSGPVTAAVIGQSAGGLRVSTVAGSEGVVRTLDDPDVLRRALCTLSGRDLTVGEWRRFVGPGEPLPCARGLP
jgi:WD40 repeat protein